MNESSGIKRIEEAFEDKRIERNSGVEDADKIIYLNLGAGCNQDCLFCLVKGSEHNFPFVTIEKAKEIAMKFAAAGGESIFITGGEPSIRPDLPELISFLSGIPEIKNMSIVTNGTGFADPEYTAAVMKADTDNKLTFSISLHSNNAEAADKITAGRKGDFDRTVAGIDNIIAYDKQISIYCVVQEDNYKDLPDFSKWLEERFPKVKAVVFAYPFPQGNAEKNSWIYVRFSDLKPYLTEALKFLNSKGYSVNIATCGQFPLCVIPGFEEKVINPIIFYSKNVAGTVGGIVFHETEWSAKSWIDSYKSKPDACQSCVLNQVCQGFWKQYVSLFGFDGVEPTSSDTFSGNKIEVELASIKEAEEIALKIKRDKFLLVVAKGDDSVIDYLSEKISEKGLPCVICKNKKDSVEKKRAEVSPYLYAGYHCNNSCVFCSEEDEYLEGIRNKDTEEIKEEIAAIRQKFSFINIMGREPTLRKDIREIIAYAKSLGFSQVGLTSNGRMFSYEPFARSIIKAGLNQIGISLLGATEATHDYLSAFPGSFNQTVAGIKNVVKNAPKGFSFLVNVPLSKKNLSELGAELDLLIEIGVKEINVLWVAPLSRRSRNKDIVGNMSDLGNAAAEEILKRKDKAKFLMVEFLPCSLKKEYRNMFFPCLEKNNSKIRIPLCSDCPFAGKCDGVLKDYLDMYGDEGFSL